MAFRIPQCQGCRFINISSHVIACQSGVQLALWYCLGSGSSHSGSLLQVIFCIWKLKGIHQVSYGYISSCLTLQPLNFFHFYSVHLRQEHGQQSYIFWTNLSILNKGLYNSLFSFQVKPFPVFPGWVFLYEAGCELGGFCCTCKRYEGSSNHLDFREVLLTFHLRFLWHHCHLKSYCLD